MAQERELNTGDIGVIQGLLAVHLDSSRTRPSEELCRRWGGCNATGNQGINFSSASGFLMLTGLPAANASMLSITVLYIFSYALCTT